MKIGEYNRLDIKVSTEFLNFLPVELYRIFVIF